MQEQERLAVSAATVAKVLFIGQFEYPIQEILHSAEQAALDDVTTVGKVAMTSRDGTSTTAGSRLSKKISFEIRLSLCRSRARSHL
jgi:hypothetical protein